MKFDLVLINFPFDDFKTLKVRPALCITERISVHNHVVLAAVTSNLNNATEKTDLIINCEDDDFKKTGLKVTSVIKLHKLLTASDIIIQKKIGHLPENYHLEVYNRIALLFGLSYTIGS